MKVIWPLLAVVWIGACGGAKTNAPPLPKVGTAGFEASVRDAVDRAARTAEAAPDDAAKVADFGLVLHAHDQFAAAAQVYRRALALSPQASTQYLLGVALAADGKYAEALDPLRQALQAQPNATAIQLKLADTLLAAGELDKAREQYQAVLQRDAQNAAAHYGLGRTLAGDEAWKSFQRALELFPRYGAAQFALANAYRRKGQAAEADAVLQTYERDKTFVPAIEDAALDQLQARNVSSTGLLRKAQQMDREGNLAGALALHEEAVKNNPRLEQAWINLISLYSRTGQSQRVKEVFDRAVALAPKNGEAYYNYGVYCVGQERWAEAQAAFTKALALDPQNADAAHNLGVVTERSGNLAQAAGFFRQALGLKPEHRGAHFHLGRIYANQNRHAEAAAEFEKAIPPLDAESPTYIYALAAVRARSGQKQAAYELLQKAKAEAQRFGQQALTGAIERDLATLTR